MATIRGSARSDTGDPPSSGHAAVPYARWRRRLALGLIDRGLSWIAFYCVLLLAGGVLGILDPHAVTSRHHLTGIGAILAALVGLAAILAGIGFSILNRICLEGITGQSIGKRLMGTALVDPRTGGPLGPGLALARWCSHGLDWLSLGFGFLLPAIIPTRRCIADLAVGSVVIDVAPAVPLRQWPSWTRTWLDQHEVRRARRPSARIAIGGVISIYALGYAYPIYLAIRSLSPASYHAHSQGGWHLGTIIEFSLNALAAVVAALVLAHVAPESFWPDRSSRPWRNQISAFGAAWMATIAGSLAASLINAIPSLHHTPPAHGRAVAWPATIDALLAGPTEEIVVLVLPLVLLRAARLPWSVVIASCLALRLAYHVYYGVPALGLEVWALAMIFIYLRTRAVLGMIIAHTMWDIALTVRQYWSQYVGVEVLSAITVCVFLAGMAIVVSKIAHGIQRGPDLPRSSFGVLPSGSGAAVGLVG